MKLEFTNFERMFDSRRVVSNPTAVRHKRFTDDGLYSERFFGKMQGEPRTISCKCGAVSGDYAEGMFCESCKEEAVPRGHKTDKMAWIDLGDLRLFNPLFVPFVKSYFGPTRWKAYIDSTAIGMDEDGGELIGDEDLSIKDSEPNPELVAIGVEEMANNLEEILDTVHGKQSRDPKQEVYEFLKENLEHAVSSKIPVYTSRLRPALFIGGRSLVFDRVNTIYTQLVKTAATLRMSGRESVPALRGSLALKLQSLWIEAYDHILDSISGKTGHIRQLLLGNRLNFSTRCVIVPGSDLDFDEIDIPYLAALEMLRFHLIRWWTGAGGKGGHSRAVSRWNEASRRFDQEALDLMNMLAESMGGLEVLLNRNPTISLGSIMKMRVRSIKPNYDDFTISLSNNILAILGGDYDGDVLNMFLLLDGRHKEHFARLEPSRMIINANDGRLNPFFHLAKDHMVGAHAATCSV